MVADRPPRPLVQLFQMTGPVRSFCSCFCLFSWDVHVFGQPRWQEGACGVEKLLLFFPSNLDEFGVADFGGRVVHGHVLPIWWRGLTNDCRLLL